MDTNVLAVAEGLHEQASEECVASATALARRIQSGLAIVVDSANSGEQILLEYLSTLRGTSTSGIGSKLAVHLWHRRWDANVCWPVDITADGNGSFAEVPATLTSFDQDDHKWIAVAVADGSAQIFQAVDQEWWSRRGDFVAEGIDVQFVCATDLLGAASVAAASGAHRSGSAA